MSHKKLDSLKDIFSIIIDFLIRVFSAPAGIALILVIFGSFFLVTMPHRLEPVTAVADLQFTGNLGMVSYQHTFFGIGGVSATTLSFQNGTDTASFTFNKDLAVEVGKTYTVSYTQMEVTYYNVSATMFGNSWNPFSMIQWMMYRNNTTINPQSVLLQENS
jgi:hypothetical protein